VTSSAPYVNIPDYPDLDAVLNKIRSVEKHVIVDSEKLAKEAGSSRAQNMVMLGASSPFLILKRENLIEFIRVLFQPRGDKIVDINLKAFELGSEAAKSDAVIARSRATKQSHKIKRCPRSLRLLAMTTEQ